MDLERLTDDRRVLSKSAFPIAIAEDRNRWGAGALIRYREVSPEDRLPAQQPKGIGCNAGRETEFRKTAAIVAGGPQVSDRAHALERSRLRPPILEVWIRHTRVGPVLLAVDVEDAIVP